MLQYPAEYEEFSLLVKRHVVYTLILRVLPGDRQIIEHAAPRLMRGYLSALSEAEAPIEQALRQVRLRMRDIGGRILEERQEAHARVVTAHFRGFTYTHRYMNKILVAECEKTVKLFLNGGSRAYQI
ncbi:hypothetical protein PP175_18675 [Aneurinibacillus sp. Ricciae_BoGa-3]|uniref:hypothetical protein n=1 Tax=Aneurinibacillus sp. Ricciae_BoGa-3 TaxID=3022697 RepID=UPI00233FF581|nr:hypothetical protein [Aneurinibacillus sp. Ricciae_BoGa-3]WCK53361.1 hypothetical protein PP175_18675 [Aneurinibacillus sp. Ricciae_BoGa-3]